MSMSDDATTMVETINEIVGRAKQRDAQIAALHAEVLQANPLAEPMRVLDHVAEAVVKDAEALDLDMVAADRTAAELVRVLERDADAHMRLPSEVQAVVGTKAETAGNVLLAKLLDETVAMRASQQLERLGPVALRDWYQATTDAADAARVREAEAMMLDRGWRPAVDDPAGALAVNDLLREMRTRRQGRIPTSITQALTALEQATRQLRMWRLTLQGLPKVDRHLVQDVVRRTRQGAVR
jgi:hypothetical protein